MNSRAEWRKYTIDGHKKFVEYQEQLRKNLGETSPALYHGKAWAIYQKIRLGLSKDRENDIKKMIKYADLDVSAYNDQSGYALRALVEFRYASKDCKKSKSFLKKAIDLGGSVDAFTIAGAISRRCGDLTSAIDNYKNALQLAPNDNGFFITSNLVAAYYQNNDLDAIKRLVAPKVDIKDIDPSMLGFYSYFLFSKGEKEKAKKMFLQAKEKGMTRKRLSMIVSNKKVLDEFIEKLRPLGNLN